MIVSLTSSLSIGRSDDDIMICLTDHIVRIKVRRENNVLNGLWMDTVLFNYRNLEVFVRAVPIRI